ncbi:MAG: formate/nitrite transporter family protein [Peptostreptococcaceae bacterium]|nr:formate/nitrite transporter family protein [Peptostreptococcaceae bacterium]
MEKLFLSPGEITQEWIGIGKKKANLAVMKTLLLAVFAGMFVGLGSHADIIVMQTLGKTVDVGLAKLIGAAVFPVGIMLVVIAGAELFTGNCLISLAVINKDEKLRNLIKNLTIVFFGNFIGSIVLAYMLANSGLYGPAVASKAIAIANEKISLSVSEAIIRGIFCNVLVVLAVWMQAGAKDISGKILAMWFPVMLFVLSGFEHSIANMYFIPLGIFLGADITWSQMWIVNIIPVTIGNIIGGAILIPAVYWYVYVFDSKEMKKSKKNTT